MKANIHPGEVLRKEFMKPMALTAYKLSKETGITQPGISAILKGNRKITARTALKLSQYFSTTALFWLNLQSQYDLEEELSKEQNRHTT